jgi:hypothetical protein
VQSGDPDLTYFAPDPALWHWTPKLRWCKNKQPHFLSYIHTCTMSGDILHTANWFSYQLSDSATPTGQYIKENVYSKEAGASEHILGLASIMSPNHHEDHVEVFHGPEARQDIPGS